MAHVRISKYAFIRGPKVHISGFLGYYCLYHRHKVPNSVTPAQEQPQTTCKLIAHLYSNNPLLSCHHELTSNLVTQLESCRIYTTEFALSMMWWLELWAWSRHGPSLTADAFSGGVQTHLSLLHKSLKNGEASSKLIMEWIIRNSLENVSV